MSLGTQLLGPKTDLADKADRAEPGEHAVNWRVWARRIAFCTAAVCAIVLLYPVLAAPITADDRYWYLWTAASSDGSFPHLLHWSWEASISRIDYGRLNVLTGMERRLAAFGIMKASVLTSTPITVYLGLFKLLLLGGGIATVLAFIRSLRWRAADGTLVRASRRTLILVAFASTLAVAAGGQAQLQDRNGWTAYPVSTYGAIISIFGSIALLLWLTRRVAEGSKRMSIAAVVLLVLLGFTTNFRYELVFAAIPVAAVALLVVPVTGRDQRAAGRRAKLLTGFAYFGTFFPVFTATRLYVSHVCHNLPTAVDLSQQACYSGIKAEPGLAAVRTTIYNLLSELPGFGGSELFSTLDRAGWADRYPVLPTWWSVLVGLAVIGAMLAFWWGMRGDPAAPGRADVASAGLPTQPRAEAILLTVGAGLSLLVSVCTAAIMGLSEQSHEIITQPGIPYRNVVVGWFGLAFFLVLVVVAFGIFASSRGALISWSALAVVIGILALFYLPANLMALRATRITHALTEEVNWEVVMGDTSSDGNARRCELSAEVDRSTVPAVQRLRPFPNLAFKLYHGRPFCTAPAGNLVHPRR